MKLDRSMIDPSEFHPLDHWPWERRCRELYGGPRYHLVIAWEFRRRAEVRSRTLCKIGRHRPVGYWRAAPLEGFPQTTERPPDGVMCADCGKKYPRDYPV